MQKTKRVEPQLEYISRFGTLVTLFNDSFQHLHPDREIADLQLFVEKFKVVKEEFKKLDLDIFLQPLTSDLFKYIKSSHTLFEEMLGNGSKISECIKAYSRAGDIQELKPIFTGRLINIHAEQSKEMSKLLDKLNRAYIRLDKKVNKLLRTVFNNDSRTVGC